MHCLYVEPVETEKCPEIVLKVIKNFVLKFQFLLLGLLREGKGRSKSLSMCLMHLSLIHI